MWEEGEERHCKKKTFAVSCFMNEDGDIIFIQRNYIFAKEMAFFSFDQFYM